MPVLIYLGYRKRDLPFSVAGEVVPETFYSGGAGIPLAGPRVILDLAIQRGMFKTAQQQLKPQEKAPPPTSGQPQRGPKQEGAR